MDEATRCDRVALMQRGRLLAVDSPAAVAASFGRPLLGVRAGNRYRALLALRGYPHTASVYPFGDELHYSDTRVGRPIVDLEREVAQFLQDAGFGDARVRPIEPGVEDTFIGRMGEPEAARG